MVISEMAERYLAKMYELTSLVTEFTEDLPDGPETMTSIRIREQNEVPEKEQD